MMPNATRPLAFAFLAASASACSETEGNDAAQDSIADAAVDSSPPATTPEAAPSSSAPSAPESYDPAWFTCATDTDCAVIVARACCACAIIPANAANAEDVRRVTEEVPNCPPCSAAPCPPTPTAVCAAGKCDLVVDCAAMERASLCGELGKCAVISGTPCDDPSGAAVRVGCFPRDLEARNEPTCGESPETGEQLLFSTTQIPDGYTECDAAQCSR